jgi:foldase protein PrsA
MENIANLEEQEITQPEEVVIIEETLVEEPKRVKFVISYKVIIIVAIIIVVAVLVYFFKGLIVAATVDGTPISRLSIIEQLEKTGGKDTLDSMIKDKLIMMEAKKKGIVVSEDDLNAETKKVEDSLKSQGTTLDEALTQQNMTRADLRQRLIIQLDITKLVQDKIGVTDKEIADYIVSNKITLTKGKETEEKASIKEQITNQKLSTEASTLADQLMAAAKINYWVKY